MRYATHDRFSLGSRRFVSAGICASAASSLGLRKWRGVSNALLYVLEGLRFALSPICLFFRLLTSRNGHLATWLLIILMTGSPAQAGDFVPFYEGITDFILNNPEQTDSSVAPLKSPPVSHEWKLDLGKLGILVVTAEDHIQLLKGLQFFGNQVSADMSLLLEHQLKDVRIPPIMKLSLSATGSDLGSAGEDAALASAVLSFEGVLLKGLPKYLSGGQAKAKLADNGLSLTTDPANDSRASLSKVFGVPADKQTVLDKLREVDQAIVVTQSEVDKIHASTKQPRGRSESEGLRIELEAKRKHLREYASCRRELIEKTQIPPVEFSCGPKFTRTIKFPIYERKASSGGGSSSSTAAIGVSGDVVINIDNPKCGCSVVSFPDMESWAYVDVSVISNGYFGARAEYEGKRDFGIVFSNQDYGPDQTFSLELSEDEKNALNDLVLKMWEEAKRNEEIAYELRNRLESEFVREAEKSIKDAIIGTDEEPLSVDQLCELFAKMGLTKEGSPTQLVCWAAKKSEPLAPNDPPDPPWHDIKRPVFDPRPGGKCLPSPRLVSCPNICRDVPQPEVPCQEKICSKVCKWKICKHICKVVDKMCPAPPKEKCERRPECVINLDQDKKIKEAREKICKQIRDWESKCTKQQEEWEKKVKKEKEKWNAEKKKLWDQFRKKYSTWTKEHKLWHDYRDPSVVRDVAEKVVRDHILKKVDSRAVAQKLLEQAWDLDRVLRDKHDQIELANDFVLQGVPTRLALSVKGSARIAFDSRAHILETRAKVKGLASLGFAGNAKKQAVKISFSMSPNALGSKEGRFGGLDVLGLRMVADLWIFLGDKEFGHWVKEWESMSKTIGGTKLSDEEILVRAEYPLAP